MDTQHSSDGDNDCRHRDACEQQDGNGKSGEP